MINRINSDNEKLSEFFIVISKFIPFEKFGTVICCRRPCPVTVFLNIIHSCKHVRQCTKLNSHFEYADNCPPDRDTVLLIVVCRASKLFPLLPLKGRCSEQARTFLFSVHLQEYTDLHPSARRLQI